MGRKKHQADVQSTITDAVNAVFSCGNFGTLRFPLPPTDGAQLSLTGDECGYGNSGTVALRRDALRETLKTFPSMAGSSPKTLDKFIDRNRYTILCGTQPRPATVLSVVRALSASGIVKCIVSAEDKNEEDELENVLSGYGNTIRYSPERGSSSERKASDDVTGFLLSMKPSVFLIRQNCYTRSKNIIRRGGDSSPLRQLTLARPVVVISAENITVARYMAKKASVFDPVAIVVVAGESGRLRDAVIYSSETEPQKEEKTVQISMF